MQLRERSNIRVPGQYAEYDLPPPPGVATFVHPTISYNPDLPPAAFPTLDLPGAINQPAEVMAVLDSSDSASGQETDVAAPPRKAIVFYDKRISPETSPFAEQIGFEESEPGLIIQEALQRVKERPRGPSRCRCGSFEHLSSYEIGEKGLGRTLAAFEISMEWSAISDGLKLIIVSELSKEGRSFDQVMELLSLSDEYINEFVEIHNQETLRRRREEEQIARSQSFQLRALMNGACALSGRAFTASLERDLYANLEESAAFIIRQDDVERASSLLNTLRITHLADRLWSCAGVAYSPNILYGPVFAEQRGSDVVGDIDLDPQDGEKSKKNSIRPPAKNDLEEPQAKTPDGGSLVVKLSLPSGLRKAVSGENLEETIDTKPAALQYPMKSHTRPAPPARKKARSNVIYVKRRTKAQATIPAPKTAENRAVTVALKTSLAENESNSQLTEESEPGKISPPTKSEDQAATKPRAAVNARGIRSRLGMLQRSERTLAAKIAKRMQKMPDSSIQVAKENQEGDAVNGPPEEALPHRVVDEPQPVANQVPADMRTEGTTNILEEKTIKIPTIVFRGMATKALSAQAKGQRLLEVMAQGSAADETAIDEQEKGMIIVVRDTGRPKRKRQDDPDDDPDL